MIALALDGPYNGEYLNDTLAKLAGYELVQWQSGEEAWIHGGAQALAEPVEFVDDHER